VIPSQVLLDSVHGERLVEIAEGPQGVVAVTESPLGRSIKVDNHYVLGGTGLAGDERQLGHIPLLLHPNPKRVAFLGLGTAITAGAAVLHPVAEIDAVELLPEVASAARRRFADFNLAVLDDARTRVVLDDARTFLAAPPGRFDVLVGDLVVPWRAGESALYTREHFEHARAALDEGGLFCQWLPAYQLSVAQFDTIAATFLDVFPRATLWRGDWWQATPTLALIGHTSDVDPDAVAASVAALRPKIDAMSPYLADVAGLWLYLIGSLDRDLARFRSARRHTFDAPWLELAAPGEAAASGSGATLVGARLGDLLAEIGALPIGGTALARLREPRELAWRAAGAEIWRAGELVVAGRGDEGRELARRTLDGLPAPLRDAILAGVRH
jgi:spermidine synthase